MSRTLSRKKPLPSITKPFSHVHSTLSALGFTEKSTALEGTQYELKFRDPATLREYPFRLYTHTSENGQTLVNLAEAGFQNQEEVPGYAHVAADQIMCELIQYLHNEKAKVRSTPIQEAMNGRMATNEAEVRRLGKSMSGYPTNAQVRESGLIPDPIQ